MDVANLMEANQAGAGCFIYGCLANNESLPFPDASFDCYLAPLSLHVMNDYTKMLKEALRVTKPGAKCGFSLWGRRENISIYPLLEDVMERHGLGPANKPTKTNYDLAHRHEELRKEMLEMGFARVKIWFQPVNFVFNTFEDFFATLFNQPSTAAKLASLSASALEALMEDAKREYQEKIVDAAEDRHFENMIIIATKGI